MEAVYRCGPSGPALVSRFAVVSEVENAPPLRTTAPVGQLTVAGEVVCGGLSAVANAIRYPFGLFAHMTSTRNVCAAPEALLTRARQPPVTGSEVSRLTPIAAKPFVNEAPPPQGTVPVGQFACPVVSRIDAGAGRSAVRTMWYPGGAVAAACAGAAVPATSPATPGIITSAPVRILRMCMSVLW